MKSVTSDILTQPAFSDKTPGGNHPRYVSTPRFAAENRLTLNRSQDEIVAKMKEPDMFGFTTEVLAFYLDWEHFQLFVSPEELAKVDLGEKDKPEQTISPLMAIQDMLDYLVFGYMKAMDERGISASRSVSKLAAWAWLFGREDLVTILTDDRNYNPYGMPALIRFAEALGLAVPADCYEFAKMVPKPENAIRIADTVYHFVLGRTNQNGDAYSPVEIGFDLQGLEEQLLSDFGMTEEEWEKRSANKVHPITDMANTMPTVFDHEPEIVIHGTATGRIPAGQFNSGNGIAAPPSLTMEQAWPNGEPTPAETDDIVKRVLGESAYTQPVEAIEAIEAIEANPSNNYHNVEREDPTPAYEPPSSYEAPPSSDSYDSGSYDSGSCDSGGSSD